MMIPIETIQIIRLYHWHMFGSCEYCGEKYVDVSSIYASVMFVSLTNGERGRCLGDSLISISVHI